MASLRSDFKGWDIGVITSSDTFQNDFGHNANKIKNFKAGNLDTYFYVYSSREAEPKAQKPAKAEKYVPQNKHRVEKF